MAEHSYFFNSIPEDIREYQATDFANYFSKFIPTGVFKSGDGLGITADGTGMITTVGIGAAFVDGFMYENDSPLQLEHPLSDPAYDRKDIVVVRLDRNQAVRSINVQVKSGTPGTSPVAPTLTDDGYIKEILLAEVLIEAGQSFIDQSQITDKRGELIDTFGQVVVEQGSNANGEYIRYANGVQECWLNSKEFTKVSNYYLQSTWSYPALFANSNVNVQLTCAQESTMPLGRAAVQQKSPEGVIMRYHNPSAEFTESSYSLKFDVKAIGRWK